MSSTTVWLIAQEGAFRGLLTEVLGQAGFEVVDAHTLADVFKALVRGSVGLIVADATDLFMYQAYRAEIDEYCRLSKSVPVLLLTNDPEMATPIREVLDGCDVLAQPLEDPQQLVAVANRLAMRIGEASPAIGSAF